MKLKIGRLNIIASISTNRRERLRRREYALAEEVCDHCHKRKRIVSGACFRDGDDMRGPFSLCEDCLSGKITLCGEPYEFTKAAAFDSDKYKASVADGINNRTIASCLLMKG